MPWCEAGPYCGFSEARPWLPIGQGHAARAVDVQEAEPNSALAFTRHLAAVRSGSDALRYGDIAFQEVSGDLLLFHRSYENETVECVFNFGGTELTAPIAGASPEQILVSVGFGGAADKSVPPFSCRIARL